MSFAKELQLNLHVACLLSWGQRIGISRQLSFNQLSPIGNQSAVGALWLLLSREGLSPTLQRRRWLGNRHMSSTDKEEELATLWGNAFFALFDAMHTKHARRQKTCKYVQGMYLYIYIRRERETVEIVVAKSEKTRLFLPCQSLW